MALQKRGDWWFGDDQADIRGEILRYSRHVTYLSQHYADAVCGCGGSTAFSLLIDGAQGVAVRVCVACKQGHPIGDSDEYMDEAELEECACPCGAEQFQITIGVALYADSEDVKWLYLGLGCRCAKCGLTAVYGDWKNEFIGYRELLARV